MFLFVLFKKVFWLFFWYKIGFSTTDEWCVYEKFQIISRHKIGPCKISAGKCVTQSWMLGVRLKNHNTQMKQKKKNSQA